MDAVQDIVERARRLSPVERRRVVALIERDLPEANAPVEGMRSQLSPEDDELVRNWRPSGRKIPVNQARLPVDWGVGEFTAEELAEIMREGRK